MTSEVSTIQSLKAVDAWIDVINANINGGVRTAFKASRLKFGGSNTAIDRAGNATSLPLQFPEPSLVTQNTVIDFSQGAVTTSTENAHLAIQGEGMFMLASPNLLDRTFNRYWITPPATDPHRFLATRDGEFRTDKDGLLVNAQGYYLVSVDTHTHPSGKQSLRFDLINFREFINNIRPVYNDLDLPLPPAGTMRHAIKLSEFLAQSITTDLGNTGTIVGASSLLVVDRGEQQLSFTEFGSTVFDFDYRFVANLGSNVPNVGPDLGIRESVASDATIHPKSLEASNASMTQSVPELSLAQKLFSALTKVLQTKQTNVDGVLNLVR
jgi:flagellar hook protein FlgE